MMRERLTITLDADLLASLDTLIDKDTLRNRSQTIEHLIREGLGLHQLNHAFLFFENNWTQSTLESLLIILAAINIRQIFICLPAAQGALFTDILTIIGAKFPNSFFRATLVPSDFGSGGAVVLQKQLLEHPFLLCWLSGNTSLPPSLLPAYIFHRQHHSTLTELLNPTPEGSFQTSGLSIASPELLPHIPAGIVDLKTDVFPALLKEAKVRGYVFLS